MIDLTDIKEIKIGTGVTHNGWTDNNPFEVVRIVNDKTLVIRSMTATRAEPANPLEFHVGGFSAHCSNQHDQRWNISSDENGQVIKIRLNKRNRWQDPHKNNYTVGQAIKFYDYNF